MNLKHRGTLPLVSSLRLLCLREGIQAVATLDRIDGLHAAGVVNRDEQDYLGGAFRHITDLLLSQQVADGKAGRTVSNYVHPRDLTERDAGYPDRFAAGDRGIPGPRDQRVHRGVVLR